MMYVYRSGQRSVGIQRSVEPDAEDVFYVEAVSSYGAGKARIEFSRAEALVLRRNLTRLINGTKVSR